MYDWIKSLLEILYAMFQGCCLQYFYGSFLEGRIRNKYVNGFMAVALYGILRLGMGRNAQADSLAGMILNVGMIAVVSLLFYQGGKIRVFLMVVFLAANEISVFLAYTAGQVGGMLISLWGWCMQEGYLTSDTAIAVIVHATAIGTTVFIYLISAALLYFPLKGVVKLFREKSYEINPTELLFLVAPGIMAWLICCLLRTILVTMVDGVQRQVYEKYPSLFFIVPMILILSLLSILCGVKLFQDMIDRNREKSRQIILTKQVESLQEHMKEMERVYSGIRGMKHDMKNTLAVIMQLASGKEEELQAYLKELNQTMDRLEFRFQTGNMVADTLLNMKYHEIIRTVPNLQMDAEGLRFPKNLYIQSYDLGIILGNALDNAVEACRKLKGGDPDAEAFIRVTSFQKRELLFLKVENSFDGRLLRQPREEFPGTDKADKGNHGMGLANMKKTAEKYQGTVDFKVMNRVFVLSVMMKNETTILQGKGADDYGNYRN